MSATPRPPPTPHPPTPHHRQSGAPPLVSVFLFPWENDFSRHPPFFQWNAFVTPDGVNRTTFYVLRASFFRFFLQRVTFLFFPPPYLYPPFSRVRTADFSPLGNIAHNALFLSKIPPFQVESPYLLDLDIFFSPYKSRSLT